jgi:hypothetical protein
LYPGPLGLLNDIFPRTLCCLHLTRYGLIANDKTYGAARCVVVSSVHREVKDSRGCVIHDCRLALLRAISFCFTCEVCT